MRERMPMPRRPYAFQAQRAGYAEQHDEGVVVDIAGLQPPGPLPHRIADGGDAIGAKAVDDLLVATLPEQVAQPLGGAHEGRLVELVEEPLVVEE
jgi:hypothetical protein